MAIITWCCLMFFRDFFRGHFSTRFRSDARDKFNAKMRGFACSFAAAALSTQPSFALSLGALAICSLSNRCKYIIRKSHYTLVHSLAFFLRSCRGIIVYKEEPLLCGWMLSEASKSFWKSLTYLLGISWFRFPAKSYSLKKVDAREKLWVGK